MFDHKIAIATIRQSLSCTCPKCHKGRLFKGRFSLSVVDTCDYCKFPLGKNDSGDGPAVFLIFILGFLLVPLALWLEVLMSPPLWVQGVLWTIVAMGICFFLMQPLKTYVIALQIRHRPNDWT